jgi:hypothetical protein
MGLVVAFGWVILDPRFRIAFLQGVYGKTDAKARKAQLSPGSLAAAWAGRIAFTWFYLGFVMVQVFHLGSDLIEPLFWSILPLWGATWTFVYVLLRSKP